MREIPEEEPYEEEVEEHEHLNRKLILFIKQINVNFLGDGHQYIEDDGVDIGPPQLDKEGDDDIHQGPLHLVDEHGNILSQIRDISEVQELIDSGQLGLRHSDRFVCLPKYD